MKTFKFNENEALTTLPNDQHYHIEFKDRFNLKYELNEHNLDNGEYEPNFSHVIKELIDSGVKANEAIETLKTKKIGSYSIINNSGNVSNFSLKKDTIDSFENITTNKLINDQLVKQAKESAKQAKNDQQIQSEQKQSTSSTSEVKNEQ